MSDRAPCLRCGMILSAEPPRVTVSLSPDDLAVLIRDAWFACSLGVERDDRERVMIADRLLCALGVVDPVRERELRAELTS